ncbi:MAG TPA: hypothetical protein VHZ51_13910 [Ktedonobacteraceae bacterium]|nr:hypothetical protein [Ktedonobacteraceae bacterium]
MFDNEYEESPRRAGKRWPLLALAGFLLVGLALLWQFHPWQAASSGGTAVTGTTTTGTAGVKEGQPDPPIYWQTIEETIAQGLHLTVAQVKGGLQPPPGQRDSLGIAHVASEQGISEAQLRIIEIDAIQKGHNVLVRMGILTQQGSDQGMQTIRHWDQATLDDHVTGWFLNN